jgi:hypothetical protein
MLPSQRVVQVCLFIAGAIAVFGGALQMYLGQPDTTPRLDNIHRFLAGIYLGAGLICFWTAATVRRQDTLIYILALAIFLGAVGRLVSMSVVGLPEPGNAFLAYVGSELVLPAIIAFAHMATRRRPAAA